MTTPERTKTLDWAKMVRDGHKDTLEAKHVAGAYIDAESELCTAKERIAELERISSEEDQRRLLRLFDAHGVECGNCECSIIARGGSLGDHHGLTAKTDGSEDEQLCGYCAGLELATIREALESNRVDAMIAHCWFSETFGEAYNGREFSVKIPMARCEVSALREEANTAKRLIVEQVKQITARNPQLQLLQLELQMSREEAKRLRATIDRARHEPNCDSQVCFQCGGAAPKFCPQCGKEIDWDVEAGS